MMTSGWNPISENAATVIGRAKVADQFRLGPGLGSGQDMNLQPELPAKQGAEQADRPRPGDEHGFRFPKGTPTHRKNMLPSLGDDGGRFHQHAQNPQGRVNLDGVFGFDPPAFGHESVDLFDAALGVLAVATHVPFAHGAVRAGNRIGAADDAHHQVAGSSVRWPARGPGRGPGFVTEHEARLARRRPAVLAVRNLDVSAANADGNSLHEHGAVLDVRFRDVFQPCRCLVSLVQR